MSKAGFKAAHAAGIRLLIFFALSSGCGAANEEEAGTDVGNYPDFLALAVEAVPSTSSTDGLRLSAATRPGMHVRQIRNPFAELLGAFPAGGGNYDTTADDFTDAFDPDGDSLGKILLNAGATGDVKSIFTLIAISASELDAINTDYTDADGNPTNCTAIADGTAVDSPFFGSATHAAFNAWDDAGKYQCYVGTESQDGSRYIKIFGRQDIASPAADCDDPYDYYAIFGSSVPNEDDTATSAERRFHYNGCTKDLGISFAFLNGNSTGESSGRSEISGNTGDHTFSIRVNYAGGSVAQDYSSHLTITGTGASQPSEGSTTGANFIMGYRSDSCGTYSDGATCTSAGTPKVFCVANSGAGNDYALAASTSDCADLETDYSELDALERSDLPSEEVAATAAAYGLE